MKTKKAKPSGHATLATLVRDLERLAQALARATAAYGAAKVERRAGARQAQLDRLAAHLGRPVPASWAALLALTNGATRLAWPGDLLSIEEILDPGPKSSAWQAFLARAPRMADDERLAKAVPIAWSGQPNGWTFVVPSARSSGELEVVDWAPDESTEFASVTAWLRECRATLQFALDEA